MPQVSVIPAKISPAPTKAESPMNAGWTNQPSTAPSKAQRSGCDANLPLQRDGLLATDDRKPSFHTSHRAALDVDDVREARLEELLASLLTSTTRTTDDIQRLIGRPIASLHQRCHVELIQRDVACDLDMDLPILNGRANVDEFDLLAFLAEFCKCGGQNAGNGHDFLLVLCWLLN